MPRLRSARRRGGLVGLDIGSSTVKAVELVDHGRENGFELVSLGIAPVAAEAIVEGAFLDPGAVVRAVREAIERGEIRTKQVAVAVSGHSVIVKKVSVPRQSRKDLEDSIQWEAEPFIPFDVNEVHLDFQILDGADNDPQMDVLLVAAKKELVDDYVQVIREAGLEPACVDVAGFAVENAFEANAEIAEDENVALVNIGAHVVNINVIQGRVPAFTRDITVGGNQYTEEIQRALSLDFVDAERIKLGEAGESANLEGSPQEVDRAVAQVTEDVVEEIGRSLEFFAATAGDQRLERLVLCGGGSKVTGLEEAFAARTGFTVERLDPLARALPQDRFDAEFLDSVGPTLGVGVGLALRRLAHG
jgi:type IV pilus assembly protein PilM